MAPTSDMRSPNAASEVNEDQAFVPKVFYPNFKLVQTGVSSTVFSLSAALLAMGVDVLILGVQPRQGMPSAYTAKNAGTRVPIWHARRNIEMLVGLLLRMVRPSMRVVFTSAAQRKHTRYTDLLMSRVDAVVATSEKSASFVSREALIIPHGVDTERFSPTDRVELRRELGLDPDASYVGVFGALRPSKGTDIFVEAMIAIAGQRPAWKAIVVGNAVSRQHQFLAALRQQVEEASLSDRISFVGHVPDARNYIRAMDICVAPSRNEGFGLTPLEAMSSSVPVVASSAGSYAETILEGVTGLLFETGNAAALERSLAKLMDNDVMRKELGQKGRERVLALFSVRREAAELFDVYQMLARDSWRKHQR